MTKVLIAGCGEVGVALGQFLAARGHEVWGLRRSSAGLEPPLRALQADLATPQSLSVLPDAIDFVFYLVAADQTSDEAYHQAYVQNLKNLLGALRAHGQNPKRIFYASSTSVYAQASGEWVDETSPTQPETFAGKRLLEGETVLRECGFPFCIVRFSGIYGVTKRSLLERVARNEIHDPGNSSYTNRIHLDDCAGVLAHLLTVSEPAGIYLASDLDPARIGDVETWIAAELRNRNQLVLNLLLGNQAARGERARNRDFGTGSRRSLSGRGVGKRCRSTRLAESGYVFRHPSFREGYTAILDRLATAVQRAAPKG